MLRQFYRVEYRRALDVPTESLGVTRYLRTVSDGVRPDGNKSTTKQLHEPSC